MAEEPNKPVEDKAETLADIEPEVALTGKETPDELKAIIAQERSARVEDRNLTKKQIEAKRQITARAHKAEAALKEIAGNGDSGEKKLEQKPAASENAVDVDERILKSQGMDPELLKQLKDVAKLRNVSLIDAQSDPLFVSIKDGFEKKKKSEEASMGGSKGSPSQKGKKSTLTPGLSRDEHKAMVDEQMKNS